MSFTRPIEATDFYDSFGSVEIPYKRLCLGDYVFGGNEASSIANLVNEEAPLNVIGTPIYEPHCAVFAGDLSGFTTPFKASAYDKTCFVVFQDVYKPPLAGNPPTTPQPANAIGANILSWNKGAQFVRYLGASLTYRAESGQTGSDVAITGNGTTRSPAVAFYYPDGSIVPNPRFTIMVTMSNATKQVLIVGDEVGFRRAEKNRVGSGVPGASTRLGVSGETTSIQRVARFAQFPTLSDDQINKVIAFIRADQATRGIIC